MIRFKKGVYVIGDPYHIFDESWDDVLEQTDYFNGEQLINNETVFGDTLPVVDASFYDNYDREYIIVNGILAIIPISLLELDNKLSIAGAENKEGIHVVEFDADFTVDVEDGIFRFDDIVINTNDEEDLESDDDFDEENEY